MTGTGCSWRRARTRCWRCAVERRAARRGRGGRYRCGARPAGCRSCCAIWACCTCHGHAVDWAKALGRGPGRGWLRCRPMRSSGSAIGWRPRSATGDVSTMGLSSAEHPLLGAATPLADSDGFLLTGRLSATEPGWLGEHAVFGTVLLPGTGLLELGFAAARAVGATTVSQLTLVAPLVLPEEGAVRVQVQVDAPEAGEEGRRGLSIYSRLEDAPKGAAWTLQAQGVLSLAQEDGRGGGDRARGMAAGRWDIDRPDGALCNVAGSRVRLRSGVPGAAGSVARR